MKSHVTSIAIGLVVAVALVMAGGAGESAPRATAQAQLGSAFGLEPALIDGLGRGGILGGPGKVVDGSPSGAGELFTFNSVTQSADVIVTVQNFGTAGVDISDGGGSLLFRLDAGHSQSLVLRLSPTDSIRWSGNGSGTAVNFLWSVRRL